MRIWGFENTEKKTYFFLVCGSAYWIRVYVKDVKSKKGKKRILTLDKSVHNHF